jgi:hypothetical protein
MHWKHGVAAIMLAACALAVSGCGYALAGRGSFLPTYIRIVGIPKIENRSTFFLVEDIITDKIRTEFIGRGKYNVTPEAAGTDAVLTGELLSVNAQPVAITGEQLASRYLFTFTMRMAFTDTRTNEVLWSDDALTFRGEYELGTRGNTQLVGSDFLDQERSLFDRIANELARTVVTSILEAF